MKLARGTATRRPHSKHICDIPSHNLLQTNDCTRNSKNNAIVLRRLRASASHELLHELLRQQTTIAVIPLAESIPSPNSQLKSDPATQIKAQFAQTISEQFVQTVPLLLLNNRHRVNGFGRGGGQTVFNQILTRFHGIPLKSG